MNGPNPAPALRSPTAEEIDRAERGELTLYHPSCRQRMVRSLPTALEPGMFRCLPCHSAFAFGHHRHVLQMGLTLEQGFPVLIEDRPLEATCQIRLHPDGFFYTSSAGEQNPEG